ncbi:MAG TPA: hypothetical protein VFJ76_02520 [Solirubrobacterales bacterium]|nr:hypothetical protein [Solirubrobacterales bacterium]
MAGRRWAKFIAAVLVVAAIAAGFAAIASAEGEEETGGFGAFRLKGTNGYSVLIMAFSRPHFKHGELLVWASKNDASVIYFVPATVTATTIDGNLGAAGRISVAFEASGQPENLGTSCDQGKKVSFQPGNWVGTITFAGEEGFTRVDEPRSKAIVNPFIEIACGDPVSIGELTGHGIRGARLVARSTTSKHALFLQVNKNHRNASVRVESSLEERRGRLLVDREVVSHLPASSFYFDPLLRMATFRPPAPFSGSAAFRRNAEPANQWTGSLFVDFPGRADVHLAGSRFHSALVRASRTEEKTQRNRLSRPATGRPAKPR